MKANTCNISIYKISCERLMFPNKDVIVYLKRSGETWALNSKLWFHCRKQASSTGALNTTPVYNVYQKQTTRLYIDN